MTRNVIYQFMWAYQEHYSIQIQSEASAVFKQIGLDAEPQVLLIGVRLPGAKSHYPACLEPETGSWPMSLIEDLPARVEAILRDHPGQEIVFTHGPTMRDKPDNLRRQSVREAVSERLEAYDAVNATFSQVGPVATVGDYDVATILQIPRSVLDAYPELRGHNWRREPYAFGFLRCCLQEVLEGGFEELLTPEPGRGRGLRDSAGERARCAAKRFMDHVAMRLHYKAGRGLLQQLNQVAALRYEKRDGSGSVEFVESADAADFSLRLAAPAPWGEARWCRKLLEMSSADAPMIATVDAIVGVGRRSKANPEDPCFRVDFKGHHHWEISSASRTLLRVQAGEPRLPQAVVPPGRFYETLARLFPAMTATTQALLGDTLVLQAGRRHGSQVVIAQDAAQEAVRLSPQSMAITPCEVSETLLTSASLIDGAILIDPNGICHAIGVVLDGPAHPACSPARGARYNSALRYVAASGVPRLVIVVSDDQTVDVLPLHRPKVSALAIAGALERLEQATVDDYHRPRNYLTDHRFYLTQDQCDRFNAAVTRIESKPLELGELRWDTEPLSPDWDFDDSYLF